MQHLFFHHGCMFDHEQRIPQLFQDFLQQERIRRLKLRANVEGAKQYDTLL